MASIKQNLHLIALRIAGELDHRQFHSKMRRLYFFFSLIMNPNHQVLGTRAEAVALPTGIEAIDPQERARLAVWEDQIDCATTCKATIDPTQTSSEVISDPPYRAAIDPPQTSAERVQDPVGNFSEQWDA